MSLERYQAKRDFGRTAEPKGATPAGDGAVVRRFVVQRHRASRLHYDFRLEIGGVLVSWSVPRGPSLRPLERRMAVRTEDHPIEYLDFEGVIPAGEYGAGDVIVWDRGTWRPETADDPEASVSSGELKFELSGQRLRGRFVLVRTRMEQPPKEDWLLIHKRDEHSDPLWDIDDHPTSVLTGRTNEDVRLGRPPRSSGDATRSIGEIDLSAARPERLPDFLPPMLATSVSGPFDDPDWLFELKLDGYRVQAIVHDGALRIWTRNRKDAVAWFPAFGAGPPTWIAARDAIVDGEMVALDADGRPSFSLLQDLSGTRGLGAHRGERAQRAESTREPSADPIPGPGPEAVGRLVYHAFDLLHLDGQDLRDVPLVERKRLLRLVMHDDELVRYVSHVAEHGIDFHAAVRRQGLEGSIAKLARSAYESGHRSRAWLKIKARLEQELVVVGYEPGRGTHAELGALLVATREGSAWRFAGEVGSGLDRRSRGDMRRLLDEHGLDVPPVDGAPHLPDARWSEPRHVIRAEFTEWTSDGLLRQASYKGREMGRDPLTVHREHVEDAAAARDRAERDVLRATASAGRARPVAHTPPPPSVPQATSGIRLVRQPDGVGHPAEAVTGAELSALEALGPGGRWQVGGHEVNLTNLDKVLFPAAGLTKRDLVRYYVTIAPVLLPYLRGRPLNTHRWPDGVGGDRQFWQKQIPSHAPDWVARWDYPEAGHDQSHTYVVADRVATMAWLANQAVIDLHPWTGRLPEYWRPTYAYIDIDPGERTTWQEVLVLARLYRTALGHLGVSAFPKVTGKRGIQVWVPLAPRYTFDDTRDWVLGLSRSVAAVVPELVSWEWSKSDRGGKARLDYTQNVFIKTLVAPYAVRPVPNAAVSAPVTWEELDDPSLRPDGWDVRSLPDRVERLGDLFAGALEMTQELPPLG